MNIKKQVKLILFILYFVFDVSYHTCESKLVFNCQKGFSKFGSNCYYLSTKKSSWQDAYFECKYLSKQSKLAILPKEVDNHNVRKFLKYRKNETEERWIGGIYDWINDQWKWAATGHKIQYNKFERIPHFDNVQDDHWQCIAINPNIDFTWTSNTCLQKKYFICESKPQPECIDNTSESSDFNHLH